MREFSLHLYSKKTLNLKFAETEVETQQPPAPEESMETLEWSRYRRLNVETQQPPAPEESMETGLNESKQR